jgi:hypothetical protein
VNIEHELVRLLDAWEQGDIDELDVLRESDGPLLEAESAAEAAGTFGRDGVVDERSPEGVLVEILQRLAFLYDSGAQVQDVPAMRAFLDSARRDPVAGWQSWSDYWAHVDTRSRATENMARLTRQGGGRTLPGQRP